MTPTEIIATRLFGWERVEPTRDDPKVYEHPTGSTAYVGGELDGTGYGPVGGADWPDLTDYNDIRRMEDALWDKSKDLYREYVHLLHMSIPADERSDNRIDPMRATAEQRVAAALKVLEGLG